MASPLLRGSVVHLLYFSLLLHYPGLACGQTNDGGAASGVKPGDIGGGSDDAQGSTDEGAAGPDTGAVNLSRGATVAIAVVVSIVVVLGITLTILYFLAKKRQWKVKEGLRRSVRKVGSAVKAVATPLTPKRMNFPRAATARDRKHPRSGGMVHQEGETPLKTGTGTSGDGTGASRQDKVSDVEKGLVVKVESSESESVSQKQEQEKDGGSSRPRPPRVRIPPSSFEMDSPQTPMWKKVFGR